jgi:hypothetical protein
MKAKIKELANQVGLQLIIDDDLTYFTFAEKFAELIVRECANRASWAQDTGAVDIGGEVLKHFGVEE